VLADHGSQCLDAELAVSSYPLSPRPVAPCREREGFASSFSGASLLASPCWPGHRMAQVCPSLNWALRLHGLDPGCSWSPPYGPCWRRI